MPYNGALRGNSFYKLALFIIIFTCSIQPKNALNLHLIFTKKKQIVRWISYFGTDVAHSRLKEHLSYFQDGICPLKLEDICVDGNYNIKLAIYIDIEIGYWIQNNRNKTKSNSLNFMTEKIILIWGDFLGIWVHQS